MKLTLPLTKEQLKSLRAGDSVYLSGKMYTARDEAHKMLVEALNKGEQTPIDLKGAVIYYAGPCPAPKGKACGSCGPTTSARMNSFAPRLLREGVAAMIGKGEMSEETVEALKQSGGVYFAAIGGAGATYGNAVKKMKCVAYPHLLSEAIYELEVENFPLVVAIDSLGNSIYRRK